MTQTPFHYNPIKNFSFKLQQIILIMNLFHTHYQKQEQKDTKNSSKTKTAYTITKKYNS